MRILLVQESDWLDRGPHQQHHLLERLQQRGHQVRVIDFEIDWSKKPRRSYFSKRSEFLVAGKTSKDSRIKVIRPSTLKMPLLDYVSIPITHSVEVYRQIRSYRPDVTIGLGILNTYVAMMICRQYHIPFVYYLIDALHTLVPMKNLRLLAKMIERRTMRRSNLILVINRELKEYATRMGADPRRVALLGAGIDTKRFNPDVDGTSIRKKFGIREDETVLFFMGWLYSFSGIREVANSLLDYNNIPKIRLLVLGKGDDYVELLNLKKKGLHDRLILADWQPYEKVPEYVAASDICLLPAYDNEIMRNIVPIKVYEYMACGKPLIATELPGLLREFGRNNGVIYVTRPEKVIEKVVDLLKDSRKLEEIGLRGARYTRSKSWENIVMSFERHLQDTL